MKKLGQLSCIFSLYTAMTAMANPSMPEITYPHLKSLNDLPPAIQTRLKTVEANQDQILIQGLKEMKSWDKSEALQTTKLEKLIPQNTKAENESTHINFLAMQLMDAIAMLMYIPEAVKQTDLILNRMSYLANEALNGTYSDTERRLLDKEFQQLLAAIDTIQTAPTLAGDKKISNGDVIIKIGEGDQASTLTVKISSFTVPMLGLSSLSIANSSDASTAFSAIAEAKDSIQAVLVETLPLQDAEIMLASIPHTLAIEYNLLDQAKALAMQAANDTHPYDLPLLDKYFSTLKAIMTKAESYVSLDGTKKLGGGNIHIQIGREISDTQDNQPYPLKGEVTHFDIHLPASDPHALNWHHLAIDTSEAAKATNVKIAQDISNFVYMK